MGSVGTRDFAHLTHEASLLCDNRAPSSDPPSEALSSRPSSPTLLRSGSTVAGTAARSAAARSPRRGHLQRGRISWTYEYPRTARFMAKEMRDPAGELGCPAAHQCGTCGPTT